MLRLIKHADAAKNFRATATFLGWLNQLGYPAPSVRLTRNQQLVGIRGDWTMLLLSFIEGKGITPEPFDLRLLSARLGQLHALDHNSAPAIRLSRCHPETIATHTIPQLDAGIRSAPEMYIPLFKSLYDSMSALLHKETLPLGITHGDCWYMNAIKTDKGEVYLIDWNNVGIGTLVLDLGYLLLSSHFRLEYPFCIEPHPDVIQPILEGYKVHYLSQEEIRYLLPAVHFLLVFQLGEYYENNETLQKDDPFLAKIQLRFNHAATIAQMAAYVGYH